MRIDKVARAYLAMRAPQRYPAIHTSFGKHSQMSETLSEDIFVDTHYSEREKYAANSKEAERIHSLHSEIKDGHAISHYVLNSLPINSALHEHYGKTFNPDLDVSGWDGLDKVSTPLDKAKELDTQLQGHVAKEDFHTYTGLFYSPFKHAIDEQGNHMVHMPAFTSTSTSFKKALTFSESDHTTKHEPLKHGGQIKSGARHVLKLNIPKGTQIASVKHLSRNPDEDEFLMNRGYDIAINPTPIMASGESNVPVYVWSATPTKRRPKPIQS